mgnify:FL=1
MINQKIRAFLLVFVALVIISFQGYSDDIKPQNAVKKSTEIKMTLSVSTPANNMLGKGNIEETFLGNINFNGIGLISIERTKFPGDLWSNSSEVVLSEKLKNMPRLSLASTNRILKRLLLVDASPPLNSIGIKNMGYSFLLSRIDQLINLGALDEAEELLNYIKEPSIEFMKRKIEVASLNGRLSKTCDLANKYPNFKGMLQFKIICLVRNNDWQAAALAFTVGSSLKQFSQKEEQLLLNFLDPDIESNYNNRVAISDLSPTNFYLMHGNKELIPPEDIPNKYAYAFSRSGMSPKVRIKSAEQLASNYVVNPNTLFNLYRSSQYEAIEKTYNAKKTVIELDQSFKNDSEQKKLVALRKATRVFQKKSLLAQLSSEYKNELNTLHHSNDERLYDLAIALLSLTDGLSNEFFNSASTIPSINCLIDIKKKIFISYETDTELCKLVKKLNIEIIKKSFPKNRDYDAQMEKGLILLESLNLLGDGFSAKREDLKLGLSMLTKIGLIDLVNEISIELIALNALKKMAF